MGAVRRRFGVLWKEITVPKLPSLNDACHESACEDQPSFIINIHIFLKATFTLEPFFKASRVSRDVSALLCAVVGIYIVFMLALS